MTSIVVAAIIVSLFCATHMKRIWTEFVPTVGAVVGAMTVLSWTIHSYWADHWLGAMRDCRQHATCVADVMHTANTLYFCPQTKIPRSYWTWMTLLSVLVSLALFVVIKPFVPDYTVRLIIILATSATVVAAAGLVVRRSWNPFIPNCAPVEVVLRASRPTGLAFQYDTGSGMVVHTKGPRVVEITCGVS